MPGPVGSGVRAADEGSGDAFYPKILDLAVLVGAKVLLVEVEDIAQAIRVAVMVVGSGEWTECEIWRDFPAGSLDGGRETVEACGREVGVKGEGDGRAVLAWRAGGGQMVGKRG